MFFWHGRSRKQILYVIIMHILIVSSALAAFLFIRLNKILLNLDQNILLASLLAFFYINGACVGPEAPSDFAFFLAECVSHAFGLVLVGFLLYIISPLLALCVGIPSSIGFVGLCCGCLCAAEDDLQENKTNLPV